jgi:hypothetical protein
MSAQIADGSHRGYCCAIPGFSSLRHIAARNKRVGVASASDDLSLPSSTIDENVVMNAML